MDVSKTLRNMGYTPILNLTDPQWVEPVADILCKHGFFGIELLLRNPKALEHLAMMKQYKPEMAVGAGTVLTVEQAQNAVAAGADFLVCPGYDQSIVDWCNQAEVLVIPGCATASEMQAAYTSGLRLVKFFPAEPLGGLAMLRQYVPLFPDLQFVPTNGMNTDNMGSYLKEDFVASVGGSFFAPKDALASGDWAKIDETTAKIAAAVHGFSLAHVGINAAGDEDAVATARALCELFLLPLIDKSKSTFAGTAVEVMKHNGRGAKGHIGFRTNNVERAAAFLQRRGVGLVPETAGYDSKGQMKFVYLDIEIGGFALHIVQ